jgi:DUF1365 family protein
VAIPSSVQSAIYDGWLRHRRSAPKEHAFSYRLFMLYLDLDEIDGLFARRWLWSVGRRNLAEFRRGDYHGDPNMPLDQAVRDTVASRLGRRPDGEFLLRILRRWPNAGLDHGRDHQYPLAGATRLRDVRR